MSGDPSVTTPQTRVSLRTELRYLAVLLIWFASAAVLGSGREVPVVDDWVYAWSVEHMLRTGRFDVLEFSAVYPLAVTLWGAAWASLLGFSFVTLRLSTLALGLVATTALYLVLRELRSPKHIALLGAVVVATNPMFFLLASSFMTDVPFMACTMMALLCYVRAQSRGQVHLVWWAGLWGLMAMLTREIGVITPVAGLPLLLRSERDVAPLPRRHVIVALAATCIVMALSLLVLTSILEPTSEMTMLRERLSYLLLVSVAGYLVANLNMLTTIAFHALPALLAMASTRNLWRPGRLLLMAGVVAAILLAAVGEIPEPLRLGGIWSLRDLGLTRTLVRGQPALDLPVGIATVQRGAGLLALALGLAALVPRFRWRRGVPVATMSEAGHRMAPRHERARGAIVAFGLAPVVVYLSAYLVVANALWFYHDRYWLPVLFAIVVLALGRNVTVVRAPALAWSVAALFAAIALVGTRDTLRFNQALRDGSQALVDRGVPRSDIDAGYSWNGWMLYAHPENLPQGPDARRDVPWVTTMRMTPYVLATTPMPDYLIERKITWDDRWWPRPDRLFVLRRQASGTSPSTGGPVD
jgi:4-amino-4-deoxy-L-arabinose transferase-like glycosyltransferase